VRDGHSGPIVLLDEARGDVYVVATSPASGAVYYKRSPIEALSFKTGRGDLLIGGDLDPRIGNPTSTRDGLTADSGLVVLASDNTTGRYVHGVLAPREPGSASPPPSPPREELHVVVNDTFEPWRAGEPLPATWVGQRVAPGAATIRMSRDGGAAARLVAVDDGSPPRLCRGFVPITSGSASIRFRVRVSAPGRSEPVLGLVRGAGGDAAEIRFGSGGTFRYFDGDRRMISQARWRPETWYSVTLTLAVGDRTATLTIADDGGADVLRRSDVAFSGQATSVEEICLRPAGGDQDPWIEWDDLIVARSVGTG
jgi:hypothetical protein